MRFISMRSIRALVLTSVGPACLAAQTVPAHPMGAIVAEARETFGVIAAIRPLSDGRLIVNDVGRRRLLLLDSNLAVVSVLADSAAGSKNPYGSRLGLLPFLGDTSFVVDASSYSVQVLGPSGALARVISVP